MIDNDTLPVEKEEEKKYPTLPSATYDCEMVDILLKKPAREDYKEYFQFRYKILNGEFTNRWVFDHAPKFLNVGSKLWNKVMMLGVDPNKVGGTLRKSMFIGNKYKVMVGFDEKRGRNIVVSIFPMEVKPLASSEAPAPTPAPVVAAAAPAPVAPTPPPPAPVETRPMASVTEKVSSVDEIANLIDF